MGILAKKIDNPKLKHVEIQKHIDFIVNQITSISDPKKIYLFGSAAAKLSRELSDFDIAIIFEDLEILKVERKKILMANLFKKIEVDLLFYTEKLFDEKSKVGGVSFEISTRGKVIYDQKPKV